MVTPSMLAIRVWATTYLRWVARLLARMSLGRASRAARDWALAREARRASAQEIIWEESPVTGGPRPQIVSAAE
jgi:multidrug efflux pump